MIARAGCTDVERNVVDPLARSTATGPSPANMSLGCFGCRKTSDIKPEEMLVGIPRVRLAETVKALQAMAQGPIPKSRQKG